MPAPDGYWKFKVLGTVGIEEENVVILPKAPFPNPANAITCLPVTGKVGEKFVFLYKMRQVNILRRFLMAKCELLIVTIL
ncbi:MAG: hypothetical protein IPG39_13800 [Bacteroidetes bacterium]|nr:hypothetical protein [Bacteroidota bacterium]